MAYLLDANIFIQVLAAAIDKIDSEQMKNRVAMQKMYADSFYTWDSRMPLWDGMLRAVLKNWKKQS